MGREKVDKEKRKKGNKWVFYLAALQDTRGKPFLPFYLFALFATVLGAAALWVLSGSVSHADSIAAQPTEAELQAGERVYVEHCAICHGVDGDGAGPAAERLHPRPRDFREGLYKIRSTETGDLPTDEDLFRVITEGMPGTSMPGWSNILSEEERRQVAAYIKTFDKFYDPEYEPETVPMSDKVEATDESIARGQELYDELQCWKCHGDAGRGNGQSWRELEDDWDFPILPANLTQNWTFRGGGEVEDIYMRFSTGMNGTPMPAYGSDVISDEERWHLANYVRSLSPAQEPQVKAAVEATRIDSELATDPGDPAWEQAQSFYFPLVGQIMIPTRWFTPSVTSLFVQAMYNDEELALRLTWDERSESRGDEGPPDAAAVQFPTEIPEGNEKPYFFMGDPEHPVNRWYWEAAGDTFTERTATGLGTESEQASQALAGQAVFQDGQWQLVLTRSLKTEAAEDIQFEQGKFIPIAFNVWDGYNGESGSRAAISSWYYLYLKQPTSTTNFVWIPVAMLIAAAVEWGALRMVRRRRD